MKSLKILELFAGIGACSKALENLNIPHEIVDAVEIDKYAITSFNAIHGTNFEPQDITKWDKDFEDIDLIMHGSPCQDYSVAGKQAGGDKGSGTRSSLMYESIRIIEKIKPKYVVWENVKNLLSKKHKHNFDAYLETMSMLGYNNYYKVLNAKDYGIPQNRARIFTISIRKDIDSNSFIFPSKNELDYNLQDLLEKNTDKKYFLSEKGINYIMQRAGGFVQLIDENTVIAHCPITAKGNNNWTGNFVKFKFPEKQELNLKLKDMLDDIVDDKYYLNNYQINMIKSSTYNTTRRRIQEKDYCDTLCARDWKGPSPTVHTCQGGNTELKVLTSSSYINNKYSTFVNKNGYVPKMFNPYNSTEIKDIAPTQTANCGCRTSSNTILINESVKLPCICASRGRYITNSDISNSSTKQNIEVNTKGITNTITSVQKDNLVLESENKDTPSNTNLDNIKVIGNYMPSEHDATNIGIRIRKLTPLECWRLMGFNDNDFNVAKKALNDTFYKGKDKSNSQLYKQAGNSIVVNVLFEIFKNLFNDKEIL